jgi:trehalose/maltose hydrolase-like predicted phosphorylase
MLAAVSAVKNYLQKTTQSLTGVIEVQLTPNAWLPAAGAARLGDTTLAERYFRQAAEIDLADNMGNAAGGVHAGALGGLWQAAVLGFAGLRFCGESPDEHRANMPPSWRSLSMRFQWRGRWHELTLPEGAEPQKATDDS